MHPTPDNRLTKLNAAYQFYLPVARDLEIDIRELLVSGLQSAPETNAISPGSKEHDPIEYARKEAMSSMARMEQDAFNVIGIIRRTHGDYVSSGQIRLELIEAELEAKVLAAGEIASKAAQETLKENGSIEQLHQRICATLVQEMLGDVELLTGRVLTFDDR